MNNRINITQEKIKAKEREHKWNNIREKARVFFGSGLIIKISFMIIVLFIFIAIFCPLLTPHSPFTQSLAERLQGPSAKYLLGTDSVGRDVLTRLMFGARISIFTGLLSSFWAALIGVTLGLIAGYFGGHVGGTIMRLTDAQLSIPPLILVMVLVPILGGTILGISLGIGISAVPSYVRMVYGQVLSLREEDYITAASLVGQNNFNIMLKHLLPNCFPTLIVMVTMSVSVAVMIESALAFIGVGITPPTPAWGTMIAEGYNYLFSAPHLAILPGLCLIALIVSLSIVGDGLRDALDPRLRGKL
jgi:ABC-type dipeptide/oligopeptide/nickel transport system permease subunit